MTTGRINQVAAFTLWNAGQRLLSQETAEHAEPAPQTPGRSQVRNELFQS